MRNATPSVSLKPGDVVQCEAFCYGTRERGVIVLGTPGARDKFDSDTTRGSARFLVTRIFEEELVEGTSGCDCFIVRCYHSSQRLITWVEAVRLMDDNKIYGETIHFPAFVKTNDNHRCFDRLDEIAEVTLIAQDAVVG